MTATSNARLAFIGGGNMATAILGGLLKSGHAPGDLVVVEPLAEQRQRLEAAFGVTTLEAPSQALAGVQQVVWAIKPQQFAQAAREVAPHLGPQALHLSIMAGVRSDDMARLLGTERIVRSMPNTPALIGQGIAGLYARDAVDAAGREAVEALLAPTGATVWVARESDLDAVTAVSGSGPAYVFYVIEALQQAALSLGLDAAQARRLSLATLAGATELAAQSADTPEVLRQRVTSKGGTTQAALDVLQAAGVQQSIVAAVQAAARRASELGDELSKG